MHTHAAQSRPKQVRIPVGDRQRYSDDEGLT